MISGSRYAPVFVCLRRMALVDKLGLAPLAGDLFNADSIGLLDRCTLSNEFCSTACGSLSLYQNPDTGQPIRVNYAALNVEEFGSVYEGLLEYEPVFVRCVTTDDLPSPKVRHDAATESHYTRTILFSRS